MKCQSNLHSNCLKSIPKGKEAHIWYKGKYLLVCSKCYELIKRLNKELEGKRMIFKRQPLMYIGVRNYSKETLRHRKIIRRIKLRARHIEASEPYLKPYHKQKEVNT